MAKWLNNPPGNAETQHTQVQSLVWEDPLEKGMANSSSVLAWEISQTEEPGGLQSLGLQRLRHTLATQQHNKCTSIILTVGLLTSL